MPRLASWIAFAFFLAPSLANAQVARVDVVVTPPAVALPAPPAVAPPAPPPAPPPTATVEASASAPSTPSASVEASGDNYSPNPASDTTLGAAVTLLPGEVVVSGVFRKWVPIERWLAIELTLSLGGYPDSRARSDVIDILLGVGVRSEFADIDRVARFYGVAGVALYAQDLAQDSNRVRPESNVTAAFYGGLGAMFGWPVFNGDLLMRFGFYVEARGQARMPAPFSPLEPGLELGAGIGLMDF